MTAVGDVARALWVLRGHHGAVIAPTETLRYREEHARGIAPLADVYLPRDPLGASVVLVHGGGFVIGSRRMKPMRYLAARFVEAGIAVCAIDYRMIFRGGRIDEALADVCDAFAWWRTRAPDPDAVSLVGLSAGATLAMLAAERTTPHRLACCFGLYELDELEGALARALPRFLFETADRAAWHARSPRHRSQPAMPTLLLHGDADRLVPVDQAHRLAAHRATLGLPTELVVYAGAPHGFFSMPGDAAEAGVRALVAHVC